MTREMYEIKEQLEAAKLVAEQTTQHLVQVQALSLYC